jgi:hypothetical protein
MLNAQGKIRETQMLRQSLKAALLLPILLAIIYPTVHPVRAQESPPFYWELVHIEIEVHEDGDMLVTETQTYVFTAPHTDQRYRWLPLDKVDGIQDVQVFEAGRRLAATTGIEKDQLWIRWQHPLSPPESHTFVLKYRVKGGLQIHEAGDQIFWKAVFKDRAAPIQSAQVTIRLPASLAEQVTSFQSFGVPADARQVDARTIEFVSRGPLPPGEELEVQVVYPHGLLDLPPPAWQQARGVQPDSSQHNPDSLRWLPCGWAIVLLALAFLIWAPRGLGIVGHGLGGEGGGFHGGGGFRGGFGGGGGGGG